MARIKSKLIRAISQRLSYRSMAFKRWDYVNSRKLRRLAALYNGRLSALKSPVSRDNSIAVVLTCYNHAEYIAECLESVFSQTVLPDELIIMNDCSTDGSDHVIRQILDKTGQPLPIIYQVNEENIGQANSINKAVQLAGSANVMILNDDDILAMDCIKVMKDKLASYPTVHLIGGNCLVLSRNATLPELRAHTSANADYSGDLFPKEKAAGYRHTNEINMTHSSSCFSKIAWQIVDGYYSKKHARVCRFSDRDFQIRVNLAFDALVMKRELSYWRDYSSVDAGLNS